ncbi:hypothetical protein [Rhodovulum kholense]|uniref:Uncharacterized protein n=1 Tax=Rhodovulum kholense TaxID=453584 RepID=A0A8E3ASJ3_9RHOB|nr:hypothetical protein [Rhodovulum kholense]PTW52232.1 hypothetical protein C8N38_101537 [Rhodovulum kholense]
MCREDDATCPDFEAHFRQFKEEINPGRRGLLGASLFGAGGLIAAGAAGCRW